ncbi:hypothetical protein L249_8889 [Ophiocordyceps polyrhachis-furcata BCC 54312]|uniref:Uncharacterized protein n=1 Tax=Ophiocordyceps polyrhachis-furcata BCC 54312 TaxID=1330021 RepID=A0A367L279_9HYPO|nr:hypothetical protein L249_8889 [Ophiocordyceps polyrhachis-furcata BCC 54312]
MDMSPLVKAHDHARAAAVATRQASDTTVAISEHTQAAGEFANAAGHTTSLEALRTLKLLEEHHTRLAALLKLPPSSSSAVGIHPAEDELSSENYPPPPSPEKARPVVEGAARKDATPPRGPHASPRFPSRDMSSSIASNLATARGIRSKHRGRPLSPSVSNDQAPGNVDPHPRRDGSSVKMQTIMNHQAGKPIWVPPMPSSPPQKPPAPTTVAPLPRPDDDTAEDGGYARFYNTFGSLINKISAPLAFAGLPLIQEESSLASKPAEASQHSSASAVASTSPLVVKRNPPRPQSSGTLEPDLSKIYSKATMRALARDGHSASDSFYVVPTSGHTMSYANILTYAEKEKRRLEASTQGELVAAGDEDDEDFVDARETLIPPSSGTRRKVQRFQSEKELRNINEELSLENKSLKDMLDNVSKRLHAFEASSQHSAMALAESYRVMRPGSPSSGGGRQADDVMRRRAQDAEEQLVVVMKQLDRLERDNRKMQRTLDKYRDKWEKLKAGAKARREAQVGESIEDARQS